MKYKYYKTWKELMLSCSIVSVVFLFLHSLVAYDIVSSGNILQYRATAPCHVAWIPLLVYYVNNYKYLVSKKFMTRSAGRFLAGLMTIIGCEVINLIVLVYTIVR